MRASILMTAVTALVLAVAMDAGAQTPAADAALYRSAREELARGAYRRAAVAFGDLVARHPQSPLAAEALYWQAFALYKSGDDTESLHAAQAILMALRGRDLDAATRAEAQVLDTRICATLARRGHAACAEQIATAARRPCGQSPDDELIAALDALEDTQSTMIVPALRTVLGRQDICSERVRKRAVLLMAEQEPESSLDILLDVIREDPSNDVRLQAVTLLPDVQSPRVVGVLESLVQSTGDDELRDRALAGIAASGSRGRRTLRRLIEQREAGEDLRAAAIAGLARGNETAEDSRFLREVYGRLDRPRLREKVLEALGTMPSTPGRKWLVERALDAREPLPQRRLALFAAGQSADLEEFSALYDRLSEVALKEQAIVVFGSRGGPIAIRKLCAIAAGDTDAALRDKARFWLGQLAPPTD
jgi:tetratricopeptide (TPR) repeat protein